MDGLPIRQTKSWHSSIHSRREHAKCTVLLTQNTIMSSGEMGIGRPRCVFSANTICPDLAQRPRMSQPKDSQRDASCRFHLFWPRFIYSVNPGCGIHSFQMQYRGLIMCGVEIYVPHERVSPNPRPEIIFPRGEQKY